MDIWRYGGMKIWRYGDLEIRGMKNFRDIRGFRDFDRF